jgi:hypothetical protein
MTSAPGLLLEETLESFFFAQVSSAQERTGVTLDEPVEAYGVHLLSDYARRTHDAGRASDAIGVQLLAARQQGCSALRRVGDRALYLSGVVPRSLSRSPISRKYVISVGSTAYGELDARVPGTDVFDALARCFEAVADVLGAACEPLGDRPEGLLALYERWRRARDPRDRRALLDAGVSLGHDDDLLQ